MLLRLGAVKTAEFTKAVRYFSVKKLQTARVDPKYFYKPISRYG